MKKHTYKRAFTIVELIIVIAVIGVLAAILIPAFSNMIAKANAKAALSDARSTLTSYLAENLAVVDGEIATSIVIFINKAKMYYVYGYSNTGEDMGKLMQSGGNPFKYNDLAQLIEDYNCDNEDDVLSEEIAATKAFFLRTTPSGNVKGGGTKDMDTINSTYVNLTDKIGDDLPETSQIFDGYLIGMILDANAAPGSGTNPGDNPGGGEAPALTVTFDGGAEDAENVPAPMQVSANKLFDLPAGPTRVGYTFNGWSGDVNGGAGQSVSVTKSCTLTAQWEVKTEYTLAFDPDGGTFVPAEGYSFTGSMIRFFDNDIVTNIVLGSSATKGNKDFIGWLNEASDIMYDSNTTGAIQFNGNVTLKAQWADTKYSITYNLNGGTGMGTNGGSYAINENVILSEEIPTQEGFVFDGWICSVKNNVEPYKAGSTYLMPGENTILTAVWVNEFTVSYNANGGTGTVPPTVKVPAGSKITIASGAGLSKDDFDFAGWSCYLDGKTYHAGEEYPVNDDVEFTAKWASTEYNVSYLGANAPVDTQKYATGATVTVKAPSPATRDGYTFVGYEGKDADGLPKIYQPNDTFLMPKGGATLTTIWNKLSTLTFVIRTTSDPNDHSYVPSSLTIDNESAFVKTYTGVEETTNLYDKMFGLTLTCQDDAYHFMGWMNKDDITQTYTDEDTYIPMPGGDVTFVAYWVGEPFELTYNANGGTGAPANDVFFAGRDVPVSSTVPTIAGGQIFMGWERSDMVGGSLVFAGGTIISAPAHDIELKAIWANPEFYIEFDLNGGSNGPENVTVPWTPTGSYNISATVPGKTGHSFLNWGSTLGGTIAAGGSIDLSTVTAGSTIILTANWKPYQWNVFYNANGGTGSTTDATAYNHGTEVTVMANGFTYAGFKFLSWNTSADGTGTSYAAGAKFNITAHTTLYAQWEELQAQEYTITFTMQDTFNGVAAGTVEVKMMLTSGESFTFNNANFTEYFTGFKPYDTSARFGSTFTKTITAGENTAIAGGGVNVYGFVTVGSDEYIKISTAAGFNMIKTNAEHMGKKYQLQNNITSGITAPLGSSSLKFTGTFDGNDKSITFAQTSTTLDYSGLFSYIGTTGTVKNLTVSFGTLRGRSYSGSLAGYNEGTITNCKATGTTINSSGSYTGGLVGQNTGTISHSSSSGSVTSSGTSQMIGGFVGYMTSGEIVNCHSTANLSYSGTNNALRMGGFIGQMDNGKISFSSVRCQNVNGSTRNVVGGFVGRMENGTIETSFSYITTQVYGGMYSGGFAGGLYSGTIKNCFSNIGKLDYGAVGSGFGVNMAGTSAINIINCYAVTYGSNLRTVSNQSSYAFRPGVIDWDGVCNVTNSMGLPYNMQFSTTYELLTHVANDATLTSNARDTYKWDTSIWRFDQAQPLLKTWADVYGSATVTFNANLAGVENPATQTSSGGSQIEMPTLTDPDDNKIFAGWGTSAGATTVAYNAGQSYTFSGDVTLYGVWKDKVTITFVANLTGVSDPASQIVASGSNITLPTLTGSQYFIGWAASSGATSPTYGPGASASFTSNTTLYGVWTTESGIMYSAGSVAGATDIPATQSGSGSMTISAQIPKYIPADASMTVATAASFNYWTKAGDSTKYYPGDTITVSGGIVTLTANWTTGCHAIRTVADFQTMGNTSVNSKKYVLAASLSLSGVTNNIGGPSTGGTGQIFEGVFNGNGYTLSNLNYSDSNNYVGLFGVTIAGVQIKYLNIDSFTIKNTGFYSTRWAGVLVGRANGGEFTHVVITNSSATGNYPQNDSTTPIRIFTGQQESATYINCYANGTKVT